MTSSLRPPKLVVETREIATVDDLLSYTDPGSPLAWLRRGEGIVGIATVGGYETGLPGALPGAGPDAQFSPGGGIDPATARALNEELAKTVEISVALRGATKELRFPAVDEKAVTDLEAYIRGLREIQDAAPKVNSDLFAVVQQVQQVARESASAQTAIRSALEGVRFAIDRGFSQALALETIRLQNLRSISKTVFTSIADEALQ